ncbi:hypothetical protein F2P81_001065 [Scophthalmus maximus]|uniref:Alpha-carbonic anhydrase domain-containing protein n=1 Tax=Scophthalmus maximus TaxID=52904 RepID=A0A6A4TZG7_SCOMX|nr:hypothetical protein F2P81_001065 [Scophthalmus maximus]
MADSVSEQSDHKDELNWGYEEAANGEYQSPINLNSREAQYDPSLLDVGLSPNYVVCRDCEVINDGHSVHIILKSKSAPSDSLEQHSVQHVGGRPGEEEWSPHHSSFCADPLLRDYWVYEGSLTTPPCSENVTWILYRYPLTISQLQIEEFRRLRSHLKGAELLEGNDGMLGDNFRPTQPLSDRTVRAAFQ